MKEGGKFSATFDLVCLSHLRWDFVYQRPQHLLNRCAEQRQVFFVEEPIFVEGATCLDVSQRQNQLYVITLLLPKHFSQSKRVIERLPPQFVDEAFREEVDALLRYQLDRTA
jgi:UDP-galactopyranose mutase